MFSTSHSGLGVPGNDGVPRPTFSGHPARQSRVSAGTCPSDPAGHPRAPRGKALPIPHPTPPPPAPSWSSPLQGSHTAGDRAESRKVMPHVCVVPYDDFIDTFDCVRSTPANRRPVTARTKIRAAQVSQGCASLGVPGSNPAWTEDRQLPGVGRMGRRRSPGHGQGGFCHLSPRSPEPGQPRDRENARVLGPLLPASGSVDTASKGLPGKPLPVHHFSPSPQLSQQPRRVQ